MKSSSYFIPSNAVDVEIHHKQIILELKIANTMIMLMGPKYRENLYSLYYKNYISSIFDPKARLTKLKAVLTNAFITNFSLADTIVVSGEKYNINSK